MYVSPAVQRVIASPVEDESITLRVVVEEDAPIDQIATSIEAHDGQVDRELPYSTLEVTLPETHVEALRSLSGIESIETDSVLSMTGDAGEDVSFAEDDDPDGKRPTDPD